MHDAEVPELVRHLSEEVELQASSVSSGDELLDERRTLVYVERTGYRDAHRRAQIGPGVHGLERQVAAVLDQMERRVRSARDRFACRCRVRPVTS